MDTPVSINTAEPQAPDTVPIGTTENVATPVTEKQAAARAYKTQQAFGKDYDDVYKSIISGYEDRVRDEVASEVDLQKTLWANRAIKEMAAAKGAPLDEIDLANIINTVPAGQTDPTSVIEEYFGKTFSAHLRNTAKNFEDNNLRKAQEQSRATVDGYGAAVDEAVFKREYANRKKENIDAVYEHQGWLPWGVDQFKTAVPFWSDTQLRGNTPGVGVFDGILRGDNLKKQAEAIVDLPNKQYKQVLDRIEQELGTTNPTLAKQFFEAIMGQTTDERHLNNIMNIVDLATIPGVGKVAAMATGAGGRRILPPALQDTKEAFKDMAKAASKYDSDPSAIVAATGDIGKAAELKATQNLVDASKGILDPSKQAIDETMSIFKSDAGQVLAGPGHLGNRLAAMISEKTLTFGKEIIEAVQGMARVERIPVIKASERVVAAVKEGIAKDLPAGVQHSVLDVGDLTLEPFSNTYYTRIKFGDPALGLWTEKETAENWARANGMVNYQVSKKDSGLGYYIEVIKPLNETSDVMRNLLLETKLVEPPTTPFLGAWTKWLRGAEDTLSEGERMNRKVSAYARSYLNQYAKEEATYIKDLAKGIIKTDPLTGEAFTRSRMFFGKKQRFDEWERVVKATKDLPDPDNPGQKGYFFKNPEDLANNYQNIVNRLPDVVETEAYFAFKRMMEMDRFLRNVVMYRNKARLGVETHQVITYDKNGVRVFSQQFDGVLKNQMPSGDAAVLIVSNRAGRERVEFLDHLAPKGGKFSREYLAEAVESGKMKLIQIFDPDQRPLRMFGKTGDKRVQYVLSENVDSAPMSFNQVNRKGGFHVEYDYDHYIKMPNVRVDNIKGKLRHWYEGDTTVMPISIREMGHDIVKKMNDVKNLIKDGNIASAKTLARDTLPIDFKEFHGWFLPKKNPSTGAIEYPRLSLDQDFQVVPRDKLISDIDKTLENKYKFTDEFGHEGNTFRDTTKSGSLAKQYQVPYTTERDAFEMHTFKNEGTQSAPIYKYEPAKFIDPVPAMNRALSKITNSVLADDYKIFSMEHWLRRAQDILKAPLNEIRAAPFYHFTKAAEDIKSAANSELKTSLMADHYKIRQFTGVKSKLDSYIDGRAQDFADYIYGKTGSERLALLSGDALALTQDIPLFLRSMTFHAKMGLFSIPQFAVQLSTFSNIFAVAGIKHAAHGSAAAMMTQWSRVNRSPAVIAGLSKKMENFGWKPGEFAESLKMMDQTGYGHVGGEYALLDSQYMPSIVLGKGERFLDASKVFFREGERMVRYASWHTAYKEFREKFPNAVITNVEKQKILERADLLNVNMSAASAGILNHGLLSIPTQFFTYQIRMAELFFSKRIDTLTKARMFAWNAALYGVPTATGLTGFPIGDIFRKSQLESGEYVVGDNFVNSLFMEGIPSVMTALLTGKGDIKKGNWYNIGDRFGTQGLDLIKEMVYSDKEWWKFVGGASSSTMADAFAAVSPYTRWVMSAMKDDKSYFPLTDRDILDTFKMITAANQTWRSAVAIHTGTWLSKRDNLLDKDISPLSAIFMYVTGLQPQGVTDNQLKGEARKERQERQKETMNMAIREWRRGLDLGEKDIPQSRQYFARALAILHMNGYPEEKLPSFFAIASKNKETAIETTDFNLFMRDLDPRKKQQSYDAYKANTQIRGQRQ